MSRKKEPVYKRRLEIFILLILVGAGVFLRFWNLGAASFWVDEVNTAFAAESFLEIGEPVHPSGVVYGVTPLFTRSVAFAYQIFDRNEASSRIPSAFFGVLAILLVFYLAKELFGSRVGLLSAFLMTFSHFEIGWSRVSRPYTLLQLFSVLLIILFLKGFENVNRKNKNNISNNYQIPIIGPVRSFLNSKGISLIWLMVFFPILGYSILKVNYQTIFLAGGLFCYLGFLSFILLYWEEGYKKIFNKYSVTFIIGISVIVLLWMLLPQLKKDTNFFLTYTPPWAENASSIQSRFFLFEFLISYLKFPLALFFFIGCVQFVTRRHRRGWILFWVFVVPLFLLSFVFTHRVPRYIFFIYPFFLIIAASGFMNILKNEFNLIKRDLAFRNKFIQFIIAAVFLSIFLIAPWFRIALKIPFQGDGVTNFAVTSDEWREASEIVGKISGKEDLIITSLPQVAYYYNVKSDYGLNWNNLAKAREKVFKNDKGRWADIYTKISCIESLDELQLLVDKYNNGWILISRYHLEHDTVIPSEVKEFLESAFDDPLITKRGTVLIYGWQNRKGKN